MATSTASIFELQNFGIAAHPFWRLSAELNLLGGRYAVALTVNQSRLYRMIIALSGLLNKALCLLVSSFKILEFIYLAKINLAHSAEPTNSDLAG